jgi:phospholipase C
MIKQHFICLFGAALLSLSAFDARATDLAGSGDPFTFNFDENGNGMIDFRDFMGFRTNNGALEADPTQPGNPLVLTYHLPTVMVNGDVRVWENSAATILSDVLRFTDAAGNLTGQTADRMIYYSDLPEQNESGPDDLADTGFPAVLRPNDGGGIFETGPEGNNRFQWAPGGTVDNVFNGISDAPEPGTTGLILLGAATLVWARRRDKRSCAILALCLAVLQIGTPTSRAQATYSPYTFATFAGQAGATGSTDDVGTAARFNNPQSVAVDRANNVYVADTGNHTIRKITPAAVVTTIAGSAGNSGSADGTGRDARFSSPGAVAVDNRTNLYVADTGNHTIRMITPAGAVTTLAGSAGNSGSADGTGSDARFNAPAGIAVDGRTNVYVADTGNHTVRMIAPAGAVTTIAGSAGNSGSDDGTGGDARFNGPAGIAVDTATNVYVADTGNHTIRRITPAGVVSTIAGSAGTSGANDGLGVVLAGGSLIPARFKSPAALAVDGGRYLYVADTGNHTIRRISPTGVVDTLAGSAGNPGATDGTGPNARFNNPGGIALDTTGNLCVADTVNSTIRKGYAAIQHVVLVMMENRSFDHFLGWLPGADGKQAGLTYNDVNGKPFTTYALPPYFQGCGCKDPDHSYEGGRVEYNGGACDGWMRANDNFSIGFYRQQDLAFFGDVAPRWTVCDRYFAAIMAETQPNRIYQHSAQTDTVTNRNINSPNVTLPTIWDRLAQNNVTGRYYYGATTRAGAVLSLWGNKYIPLFGGTLAFGTSQFYEDCRTNLPAVSFVDPEFTDTTVASRFGDDTQGNDDHPHSDVRNGEAFLASIYNAIAASPNWSNTVMIINYDEWGGFFDHVAPPRVQVEPAEQAFNDGRLGFRVPCLVISPWARRAHVSSKQFDHTSVLKMIENLWGIRPLTVRDANANDLADVLDLSNPDFTRPQQLNVPGGPFGSFCTNRVMIVRQQNGDVTISWHTLCPAQQLQSAPTLNGPWANVAVTDPPYVVPAPPPGQQQFYRLVAK